MQDFVHQPYSGVYIDSTRALGPLARPKGCSSRPKILYSQEDAG